MATGLIAAIGPTQYIRYTAPCNQKVMLNVSAVSASSIGVKINGVFVTVCQAAGAGSGMYSYCRDFYIGTGQTVFIETTASCYCVISAYEG